MFKKVLFALVATTLSLNAATQSPVNTKLEQYKTLYALLSAGTKEIDAKYQSRKDALTYNALTYGAIGLAAGVTIGATIASLRKMLASDAVEFRASLQNLVIFSGTISALLGMSFPIIDIHFFYKAFLNEAYQKNITLLLNNWDSLKPQLPSECHASIEALLTLKNSLPNTHFAIALLKSALSSFLLKKTQDYLTLVPAAVTA